MVSTDHRLPATARQVAKPAGGLRLGWVVNNLSIAGLLWFILWLGVDSGPWVLRHSPQGTLGYVHYLRTLGPLVALGVSILLLISRAASDQYRAQGLPAVLRPWLAYGVIALLACLTSPSPSSASYWALCYLSSFFVLWYYVKAPTAREQLDRCRHLNYLGWAVAGVLLLAILYISREALFVGGAGGMTGYGVVNRVGSTAGVSMVRASGLARFASVPALFSFVLAWRATGLWRLFWGTVALGGISIVYLMQSRGAILALTGALAFAMLFMGRGGRAVGFLVLLFIAVTVATGFDLGVDSDKVWDHLARKGRVGSEDLTTGRGRDWKIAFSKISESPLWGWGPQADRYFFRFHVHNTYLYAWLASGLLGLISFIVGLLWAWRLLLRALLTGAAQRAGQHTTLIQVGCLLTFFTIRSVPEVSGAMFGIDLLLLIPAVAWLGALDRPWDEELSS